MKNGIFTVAMGMALLFGSAALGAVTPQQKCQQAKLKNQGKLQNCLKKNAAGGLAGKDDNTLKCQTKYSDGIAKADANAAKKLTSCRYIDNGDGTVSDLNTGLVWEKKTTSGLHRVSASYSWSSDVVPDGTAFTALLGTLNGGTSSDGTVVVTPCFTGYCDWRLPTSQELSGIFDPTCGGEGGACIDPAFGPTIAAGESYWSATTIEVSYGPEAAWAVSFDLPYLEPLNKPTPLHVRAVRGGL